MKPLIRPPRATRSILPVFLSLLLLLAAACELSGSSGSDSDDQNDSGSSDGTQNGGDTTEDQDHEVLVDEVVTGLSHPWGMAFLPEGSVIVTERGGGIVLVESGTKTQVSGAPEVAAVGQGGLLDVALHPDFEEPGNGWIYFTYATDVDGAYATALGRGRLDGTELTDWQELFVMEGATTTTRHFGSRIVFGSDGYLYMSIGDRGSRNRAQDAGDHAGSTLRLTDTGEPAPGNPFAESGLPEIYSIGHRNPQGMTVHPETGAIWQNEHGPDGGDEVNIIRAGENYGWPIVSYGTEYSSGAPIGDDPEDHPEVVLPVTYWVPTSIAPSGMTFYTGDVFPGWRGDAFVGALAERHLRRLEISGEEVTEQEQLLIEEGWRIRQVTEGPEGYLWVLTDEDNGGLYRLEPAAE